MSVKDIEDRNLDHHRPSKTDWIAPICMVILGLFGIVFIYSSQSYNIGEVSISKQFWFKQCIFFCIGGFMYVLISRIDYDKFFMFAEWIYIGSILLLIPLILKEYLGINIPFVQTRFNATRWIDFGVISLQPSEIAKIGTCIMTASLLARSKIGRFKSSVKTLVKVGIVIFIPILLIFLQPDLGSTLVFPPMVFSMLYVSKLSKRFFAVTLGIFLVCMALVSVDIYGYASYLERTGMKAGDAAKQNAYGSEAFCLPLKDYQRNRILSFVMPEFLDPKGRDVSWNYRQSLISVGSGGIVGKGIAEGTQAKLGYLPSDVAYNDFIFSVIAEESGFLGGSIVIVVLGILICYSCIRTADLARDNFGQLLCIGIAAILMTHIFINIGMTIGIMPITGLPLPMLSYGGSFVLTCCILLGLVQSVHRHRLAHD